MKNQNYLPLGDDGEFIVDVIIPGERAARRQRRYLLPHERRQIDGKVKPTPHFVPQPREREPLFIESMVDLLFPDPELKWARDSLTALAKVAIGLVVLWLIVITRTDQPNPDQPIAVPAEETCLIPEVEECVVPSRFNTYSQAPCQIVELDGGRLAVSDGCRVYAYTEAGMQFCLEVQQCLADAEK